MTFVNHPAEAALARDTNEARAIGTSGIDFMIGQSARGIADPIPSLPQPLRHLRLLFMARCTRSQPLIERTDPPQSVGAKRHVRPEYAADFEYLVAIVGDG